jgi:hypothetical protein
MDMAKNSVGQAIAVVAYPPVNTGQTTENDRPPHEMECPAISRTLH